MLEAVYELCLSREVGKIKRLVVKSDAIQPLGIKPASRRFEGRKSGKRLEA